MCGSCTKAVAGGVGYTKSSEGLMVRDDVVTSAAMCAACRFAGPLVCSVDLKPLVNHARSMDCPKGRHPTNGIVKWAFIAWYGVPFPIRWKLARAGKVTDQSKLPGCGCIKVLKDLWTKTGLT